MWITLKKSGSNSLNFTPFYFSAMTVGFKDK